MTTHAAAGREMSARVAGQVRAELARHNKTAADLAVVLGVTPHTAGRRLNGHTDFTAVDLVQIAAWLDLDPAVLFGNRQQVAS